MHTDLMSINLRLICFREVAMKILWEFEIQTSYSIQTTKSGFDADQKCVSLTVKT